MSKAVKPQAHLSRPKRYVTSAMLLVIAVGLTGSGLAAFGAAERNRDLMLSRAVTAASALQPREIMELNGRESDIGNPTYRDIKSRLTRIRQENPGMRFAYLLGRNTEGVFFYVDSEPPDSESYSPPGERYPEATVALQAAFADPQPFIEGPVSDRYGTWFSALAPVTDNRNRVIAVLGVDVKASEFFTEVAIFAITPILLTAFPLLLLMRNRRLESKEQEVVQLKTQFVSVASHELRSPLTGTLWGAQALLKLDKGLDEQQKRILTDIYNSTAASLATVNEILDFSIFERHKADKLQRESLDLHAVLNDVIKLLSLTAKEHNVAIVYQEGWPETAQTKGDPGALKRAFSNILSNAIKYSHADSTIEIGYDTHEGQHVVAVRDHGIGIPKADMAKVQEGYYRAANASKVQAHGTGMGLWVTKMTIDQHGGNLRVESVENEGTTVYISLPVDAPRTTPQAVDKTS